MFEKEAKERAKDYTDNAKRQVAYECGFLDGVDLGYNKANEKYVEQFTRAKEIIEELYNIIPASMSDYAKEPMEHARKFMTEE